MTSDKKVSFYKNKPETLPRFVYRRLTKALLAQPSSRPDAIKAALSELAGDHPDLRKLKFFIPDALKKILTSEEILQLTEGTGERRAHSRRLKMVFPHVSDEFSLDKDFLGSLFELDGGPELPRDAKFFAMGSCFARNIAEYLNANGNKTTTFAFTEDLNSPVSNAFLLDLASKNPEWQATDLTRWIRRIFPEYTEAEVNAEKVKRQAEVASLIKPLASAGCVILTLGNVVDFFQDHDSQATTLGEKIFPKYIALPDTEDVRLSSSAASRLKRQGAVLRLASYGETCEAIRSCIRSVRALTQAPIVITVSPVPIDSAIGLVEPELKSAIEVDCVSKSRLRSALHEIMVSERATYSALYYFPSFEIVRWVAPMLDMPTFGLDDAAARHVSSPILDAVCSLFLQKFLKLDGSAKERRPESDEKTSKKPQLTYSFGMQYSLRGPQDD